jgi:hypothetical protein
MVRIAFCAVGLLLLTSGLCAAQPAAPPPRPAESCVAFDPTLVTAGNAGGSWKVAQGETAMLDFGDDQAGAQRAADIIRHYHFTRQCFVRGADSVMMYWKNGVAVPPGNMPGQDCIVLNPANVAAQYSTARWKVVDGNNWLLDYGPDRAAADQAAAVIHTYSLNRECFVDRSHLAMQYWLAE